MSALSSVRHARRDGLVEIVFHDPSGKLFAIIDHDRGLRGARWFLHIAGAMTARGQKFSTCKAAIAAAEQAYQPSGSF